MTGTASDPSMRAQRKRALLVCFRCHSKKIKCDLSQKPASQSCSHCSQAQVLCQLRPSRRGLRKRPSPAARHLQFADQDTAYESHGGTVLDADPLASMGEDGLDSINMDVTLPQTPAPTTALSSIQGPYEVMPALRASGPQNPSTLVARDRGFPIPSPSSSHNYGTPPNAASLSSRRLSVRASSFGQSGYMTILGAEEEVSDKSEEVQVQPRKGTAGAELISPALQDAFAETYLEYCYTWCPVLDPVLLRNNPTELPPLLQNALALLGTRVNPPLVQFREPAAYYERCKEIFYSDSCGHPLLRIAALMLFFWWSTGPPNQVNMDNAWWWTGITIRAAQEYGLNREPKPSQITHPWDSPGLRRRIWWTLFARDRILSISQGRPTIIDSDYTSVEMVTPADFPDPTQPHVHVFIRWVELQAITGRISKHLSRRGANGMMPDDRIRTSQLLQELSTWVNALPQGLALPTPSAQMPRPSRDVFRLHLTYLSNVVLLHLTNSSQGLPRASKAAVVAASCIARLFEYFLIRGDIRFLTGDAGWEVSVALLALLHARRMKDIGALAETDIHILRTALQQLGRIWPSSRMFLSAFEKMFSATNNASSAAAGQAPPNQDARQGTTARPPAEGPIVEEGEGHDILDDMADDGDADSAWMSLFPFVTAETSPLIRAVLNRNVAMSFPEIEWPFELDGTLQDFLSLPTDFSFDWAMV